MTTSARVRAARKLGGFLAREGVHEGASGGESDTGVAAAALSQLRAIAPFDCAMFLAWDAVNGRYSTLVNDGYPGYVAGWLTSEGHLSDRHQVSASTVNRSPLRPDELPLGVESFEEFARPNGFQDGFNLALWAPDGRYVGALVGSPVEACQVDDVAVDLLALLAPRLAPLVDPVPTLRPSSADLAEGHAEGIAVSRTGQARALTSGAELALARHPGPLRPMIHLVSSGDRRSAEATVLFGGRMLAVSISAGEDGGALVLHRAIPAPFRLSTRELEILDGLAEGATNTALATRFAITARTVATHIERLLVKTGCHNRTAAARLAASLNLLIDRGPESVP